MSPGISKTDAKRGQENIPHIFSDSYTITTQIQLLIPYLFLKEKNKKRSELTIFCKKEYAYLDEMIRSRFLMEGVYRGDPAPGQDLALYLKAEEKAKAAKRGMWVQGDKYMSPREWRKTHP